VSISFPDIETDDNLMLGQAGFYLSRALQNAEANGWVSKETAARLFFQSIGGHADTEEGGGLRRNKEQSHQGV
jgi:hypothetical protein